MSTDVNGVATSVSWGIRDFQLTITPCPAACVTCTFNTLSTCNLWSLQSSSWSGVSGLTNDGW